MTLWPVGRVLRGGKPGCGTLVGELDERSRSTALDGQCLGVKGVAGSNPVSPTVVPKPSEQEVLQLRGLPSFLLWILFRVLHRLELGTDVPSWPYRSMDPARVAEPVNELSYTIRRTSA